MATVAEAKQRIASGAYDSDIIDREVAARLLDAECRRFNPKIEPMSVEQALTIAKAYPEQFIDYEGDWDRRNVGDRFDGQD